MLTDFLGRHFVAADGRSVLFADFVTSFHRYLFKNNVDPTTWPRKLIREHLIREGFVVGRGGGGVIVGNLIATSEGKRWVKEPGSTNKLTLQRGE